MTAKGMVRPTKLSSRRPPLPPERADRNFVLARGSYNLQRRKPRQQEEIAVIFRIMYTLAVMAVVGLMLM